MKTYTLDIATVLPLIREEISRTAADAYDDSGASLYDAIVAKSRDDGTLSRHMNDAMMTIVSRFSEIATISDDVISFDIPTARTHSEETLRAAADRYVTLYVCAAWMMEKHKLKAEDYATRASDALTKLERLLYEKLPPVRPTHIED